MNNKRMLVIAMLLAAALLLAACTPKPAATPTPEPPKATDAPTEAPKATDAPTEAPKAEEQKAEEKSLELTLEELAKFNGKDGQPAYIAVDGVIYDVSEVAPWKGGTHNGYESGKDLTTEIKEKSPHGISKLQLTKEVGKLVP